MNCDLLSPTQRKLCNILSLPVTIKNNNPSGFTNNRDTDILILTQMSDEDLLNVCSVNTYLHSLCNQESFWINRLINRFGNQVLEGKLEELTWKDYYLTLVGSGSAKPIVLRDPYLIGKLDLGTIDPTDPNTVLSLSSILAVGYNGITTFKELLTIIYLYQKINGKNPETNKVVNDILNNIKNENELNAEINNVLKDPDVITRLTQQQKLLDLIVKQYNRI